LVNIGCTPKSSSADRKSAAVNSGSVMREVSMRTAVWAATAGVSDDMAGSAPEISQPR
jgi:hypothetical protein